MDKKTITVDQIVEQLIDIYQKGISPEILKDMTKNYLIMLKLSGDEKAYNELIPKLSLRKSEIDNNER